MVVQDWEMKKSARVSPSQAKSQILEDQQARVQTKPKPAYLNVVPSKKHLAWYVPLNKKQLERKSPRIPQIKWKCPSKFALHTGWLVASGEESQEAEPQKCRESAVSEVGYTNLSPVNSLLVEGNFHDDNETPIIPIIPIEEVAEIPYDTSATVNPSTNQQPLASCPLVSGDLPASQSDPSECQDQSVHGKSLPQIPHGLESGGLEIAAAAAATVAAVMPSKDHIDTELLIKFLSDPEMTKKLMDGNGWTSKPEEEAPPAPKAIISSSLPSSTPASVVDKHPSQRNEPVIKVILSNSTKEPVNQSPILPCSSVVDKHPNRRNEPGSKVILSSSTKEPVNQAPILPCSSVVDKHPNCRKEPVSKVILSSSTKEAVNQAPILPCSSVVDKHPNCRKEPVSKVILSSSTKEAVNQAPILPCSSVVDKHPNCRKEPVSKVILSSTTKEPVNQPSILPCSSVVDKHPNWRNEPGSKVILSSSTKEPVNQSPILPCSKAETKINKAGSKPNGMGAVHGPTHTSQAATRRSQSPRFIPDGPTKKVTACSNAREHMVRPLVPSPLRPDETTIDRLVKKYGGHDITAVKPADSTMVNLEAMKKMIHDYGAPDVAWVKPMVSLVAPNAMPPNIGVPPNIGEVHRRPFMGPRSPPLLTLPPVMNTNLHALPMNATGNFRPSFPPPLTMPARGVNLQYHKPDLQYHKSLIKQHGEIQETGNDNVPKIGQSGNYMQGLERAHKITKIETVPKYRKPCLYFTSPTGCRNGFNCSFQHDVPGQWKANGAVEAPINPVAMAPVPKRMKLNEQFGNRHYF
ncbi:uncharacterized protein LOC125207077 isoform X2 [Salvia hispanica]|uniref:uncharacterized protein LOC125207077 isoform X2 n=1 Tax=Salvia hispanica TaxID=49212 RepID=UPI002009D268|nr:uncharacterized protein LOC125207077 isoform X2 [Salvia hispanica]